MFGAICGDIIGSRFERKNIKTEDFELFTRDCNFTDDTVMTLAVCDAILYNDNPVSFFGYRKRAEEYAIRYKAYYSRYSDAGFGQMFSDWAKSERLYRQRSYGNGGAMRVSSIGWHTEHLKKF